MADSCFFVPSKDWQDIPEGMVMPNGGEFRMNMPTGRNQARWETPPPAVPMPPVQAGARRDPLKEIKERGAALDAAEDEKFINELLEKLEKASCTSEDLHSTEIPIRKFLIGQ